MKLLPVLGAIDLPENSAIFGMFGGLILLYAAGRALLDAIAKEDIEAPGRRALSQWIPIAITALTAIAMNRPDIALGVVFATSVASLSLGIGSAAVLARVEDAPPAWRRVWPFVLPTALLTLLCGFSGRLTLLHAMILAIEGIVLFQLWRQPDEAGAAEPNRARAAQPPRARTTGLVQVLLGIALAGLGAWLCTRAAVQAESQVRTLSGGVVTVVLLGPGLVLAMLGVGTILASEGRPADAVTSHVGIALLNLCALLPAVIALAHILPGAKELVWASLHGSAGTDFLETIVSNVQPLRFPLRVWRVDTVILIVLGFALVPAALGRWTLGKREGIALIFAYAAYLMLVASFAARN